MSLAGEDEVVGMEILSPGASIITVTENGYGKRTPLDAYRLQRRGGQGVITIRTTARNGEVVRVAQVVDDDEVMLITDAGKVLRCPVSGISTMGRATQGVRVMDLGEGERLAAMARLAERDAEEDAGDLALADSSAPAEAAEPDAAEVLDPADELDAMDEPEAGDEDEDGA
jgi:DNA gyrase subunit A